MNTSRKTLHSYNPSNNEEIWAGLLADECTIDEAFERARKAQKVWEKVSLLEREKIVRAFAEQVLSQIDEIAEVISLDCGKPLWEARGEVKSLANKVQAVVEAYKMRASTAIKEVAGRTSVTRFRPHGVMAVLGPYNFPMSMPNSHVMPALYAGNAVVFKPSERTPFSGEFYVELWKKAGLPRDLIQVVHGGAEVATHLINHEAANGILFVGSRKVGASILGQVSGSPQKICALEMGGNSPLVIWDYTDPRLAVHIAIQSSYISSGQRCSAARRVIVNEKYVPEFRAALANAVRKIRVGNPLDLTPEPFMGPLIDRRAVEEYFLQYERILQMGALELVPSKNLTSIGKNFVSPGLLEVEKTSLLDEEIFGPLLQLTVVDSFEEAVAVANDTKYGLAAGIVTQNRGLYERFFEETRAGIINWNQPLTGATTAAPFGGVKASGNHRPAGFLSVDYCSYPCASIEDEEPKAPSILPPGLEY